MPYEPILPLEGTTYTGAELRERMNEIAKRAAFADRTVRPIEYWGGVGVGYDETPVDNRAAFLEAIDWCAYEGGQVLLGARKYGVEGDLLCRSYPNFAGIGRDHSRVVQLADVYTDTFTTRNGPGESIAFARFVDFAIYGGWQVDTGGWNEDKTNHTFSPLRLTGSTGGPDDQIAYDREDVNYIADPYHIIHNMHIGDAPGHGLYSFGRGEFSIEGNRVDGCSLNGIHMLAPDCFMRGNSVKRTGDSGTYMTGGNQRVVNEKYWFCGLARDAERIGAGLEIDGNATANLQITFSSQDTWGPSLVLRGDAPDIRMQGDEAGGGRPENDGFGWQGDRTKVRSFVRVSGTLDHCRVQGTVRGGARNGVENAPYLIDLDSSGATDSNFEFRESGATLNPALVRTVGGYNNNKRHNTVTLNERTVHGRITVAQLADAEHGINATSVRDKVFVTDGSGGVDEAVRQDDGSWRLLFGGTVVIPV